MFHLHRSTESSSTTHCIERGNTHPICPCQPPQSPHNVPTNIALCGIKPLWNHSTFWEQWLSQVSSSSGGSVEVVHLVNISPKDSNTFFNYKRCRLPSTSTSPRPPPSKTETLHPKLRPRQIWAARRPPQSGLPTTRGQALHGRCCQYVP